MAKTPYLDHEGPIAMAHRGFSLDGLENTMVAFDAAVRLGFRYVETDVHATSDGTVLAFHDETLDRVTDGTGQVSARSYADLREVRIAEREPIPTLDELLGAWPDLRVNIDLKADAVVEPTVACIARHDAYDRVCVTSFSDERRIRALALLGRPVVTSAGERITRRFVLSSLGRAPGLPARVLRGIDCLQVPVRHGRVPVVTRHSLKVAHAAGVQVHVWTVNDPAEMRRLLDLGVDGLITDRADLLKDVLVARDQWAG
jgi:glycerophosphoryl diester phosphodiesterase